MRQTIHFLHLGKNAGTQFKYCAAQMNAFSKTHSFELHPHKVSLADLPADARYLFIIRDPVSRFRSGFYSRKRCGQPRSYVPWNKEEQLAFREFREANRLAEAIHLESDLGERARRAMAGINHVRRFQASWFEGVDDFLAKRPPIAILRQQHFEQDLKRFLKEEGADILPNLARDERNSHSNQYSEAQGLSALARENLQRWYRADIEFIARCEEWLAAAAG